MSASPGFGSVGSSRRRRRRVEVLGRGIDDTERTSSPTPEKLPFPLSETLGQGDGTAIGPDGVQLPRIIDGCPSYLEASPAFLGEENNGA
ncbi:hypothetical protein ACCO45_002438 [Purpureocillium lilacinum]|uniref:Uncharacterized protein n=1 Tax=Purpureocillium lilacinum TaxID=33203 RepID=A0ACC4E9X4_PURLI